MMAVHDLDEFARVPCGLPGFQELQRLAMKFLGIVFRAADQNRWAVIGRNLEDRAAGPPFFLRQFEIVVAIAERDRFEVVHAADCHRAFDEVPGQSVLLFPVGHQHHAAHMAA